MADIAVEMRGITKVFGSTIANHKVDLEVYKGEILSLLGENGSGKTTLMNVLSGLYYPDEGKIFVNGEEVQIRDPKDAYDLKIGMVHQHFKLVDVFTAAENVVLGLDEEGRYDLSATAEKVDAIAKRYGFNINPYEKVYDMTVSEKQTLEIIKQLYRGCNILILDEPTAVLTPQEAQKLFNVIRNMRKDGKSIIIITHKLQEVLEISDRVVILRKGELAGIVPTKEATELSLTEMMVGEKVELNIDRPAVEKKHLRLDVKHLSCRNNEGVLVLDDVNFKAYSGEILGIAGISGCGQKELLESIAGLQRTEPGATIMYTDKHGETKDLVGKTPRKIHDLGVALSFVPEDRLGMGLVGSMNLIENMLLKSYNDGASPMIHTGPSRELAEDIKQELDVQTPSITTPIKDLSGGNVQKVLVGREIAASPSVLMTAYAVRGLDINTSYTIYDLLNQQKMDDVAVIYVGEDLDVLLALSDRIMVLCGGKLNGILDGRTATKEEVGLRMTNMMEGGTDNG